MSTPPRRSIREGPMRYGILFLLLFSTSSCGESGAGTDPTPGPLPEGTVVGPAGGTVSGSGVTLVVPPGALSADADITVRPSTVAAAGLPSGFLAVPGTVFDFSPDGLRFNVPVTVTIDYETARVPAGVSEKELRMLHLDGGAEVLSSAVNLAHGTVTASATSFSSFAVGLDAEGLSRVACPAVAPAASAGVPLDRVELGSLPESFSLPAVARANWPGDSLPSYFPQA